MLLRLRRRKPALSADEAEFLLDQEALRDHYRQVRNVHTSARTGICPWCYHKPCKAYSEAIGYLYNPRNRPFQFPRYSRIGNIMSGPVEGA